MTQFDTYSREQLRRAYSEAWAKHLKHLPMTALEAQLSDVIGAHPEYQELVADADAALELESSAAVENPFLHMGLHLAVREQLAIDRPPGICELQRRLLARLGSAHAAEHVLMEALGETLWLAQKSGRAPDVEHYLALARKTLSQG